MANMTKPKMPATASIRIRRTADDGGNADGAEEGSPLELTLDAEEGQGEADEGRGSRQSGVQDELLLDASRLIEKDEPVQDNVGGTSARPARRIRRQAMSSRELGQHAVRAYGELVARGGQIRDEEDEEDEEEATGPSLSIPRFLGRQNNQ